MRGQGGGFLNESPEVSMTTETFQWLVIVGLALLIFIALLFVLRR